MDINTFKIHEKNGKFFCGYCKKELTSLANQQSVCQVYDVSMDKEGLVYNKADEEYTDEYNDMCCPACGKILGDWNEDIAKKIIGGK
jgi:hypothetical protein